MAKIKRIVTSEVEGRTLSDDYNDNSYVYGANGRIDYYGNGKMLPVIEPGKIYGAGRDSGDGNGYNTIKLIPQSSDGDPVDDRYIIIDPTAPGHIHIRAGGTQDASNAELFLGAEKANVKIADANHEVHVNTYNAGTETSHEWTFGSDGVLYGPDAGLKLEGGVSGSFTTADNKTVTVTNGIITAITPL